MDSGITLEHVATVGGFLVAFAGLCFAVWKFVGNRIDKVAEASTIANGAVRIELDRTKEDLADHKLHVAQTYTTKAGMAEQTAQIMKALDGVSNKIDYTNQRLDAWTSPRATRTPRSGG